MDDQNPDSTSEPFEAYPYRMMFVAASVASVVFVLASLGVLIGGWPRDPLLGLLGFLPHQFWGALGVLYFSIMGLDSFRRVLNPTPALTISEDGVLNRTYLSSGTFVPWEDVLEIQKARFPGIRKIVLRDPAAFRRRQTRLGRMIMRLTALMGLGPLPVHLWQLNAPWVDAVSQLEGGLELFQLRSVQEQQLLEGER